VCVRVCVCVCSTYSVGRLWNTCKNKARGRAQETKGVWGLKAGLCCHQRFHEQRPHLRKLWAYHVAHIHAIMFVAIESLSPRESPLRAHGAKHMPATLYIVFPWNSACNSGRHLHRKELLGADGWTMEESFPHQHETMELCSLSPNGCSYRSAPIVRTGSSLWRQQEVDTWRLGLLFSWDILPLTMPLFTVGADPVSWHFSASELWFFFFLRAHNVSGIWARSRMRGVPCLELRTSL